MMLESHPLEEIAMSVAESPVEAAWPALELDAWEPTRDTLHLWTQIVGKVRMALAPPVNHWWHVPLYVSARGLTTSAVPYGGAGTFEMEFDFLSHELVITCGHGGTRTVKLEPRTVADFYAETMARLREL